MESQITRIVSELFNIETNVVLTRPDAQFGDYATNVALQLAKPLSKNPREVAEQLAEKLRETGEFTEVTVAGPGFINLRLADSVLVAKALRPIEQSYAGKIVVAEYSDPNPFKVLHAGHLYTSIAGDAMANLLQAAGATVHRVNFGGDVGLHVGKTIWAMIQELGGEYPEKLADIAVDQRSEWMASTYVKGTNAYEDDEQAKAEIIVLNKRVYAFHTDNDHESPLARLYWTCRQWSYDYFNAFYDRIGTKFEKYYPESEVADLGLATVQEQLANGVFKESDGAIVFEGEPYGLHTRVFINREGIPTYEAKDVGLSMQKWSDYHFDTSVIITGSEQLQYMQVVLKAIEQFAPELSNATRHFTHGLVKLQGGVKMSSRKGNILRAVDVLDEAARANIALLGSDNPLTTLGAVKYAFLKVRVGGDIAYDPKESVSLDGNSGPYLQYAHARARSIIEKSTVTGAQLDSVVLDAAERTLVVKIGEFTEVVARATAELLPHLVCTYLYELAQEFNRFYEHSRVIGDEREAVRIQLITHYAATLKTGLELLGITAPERM